MSAPDLHALPPGSVVVIGSTVAIKHADVSHPWTITDAEGAYTVGHLLAMSQDWVVLRRGNAQDEHGTDDGDDLDEHYDQARAIVHPADLDSP